MSYYWDDYFRYLDQRKEKEVEEEIRLQDGSQISLVGQDTFTSQNQEGEQDLTDQDQADEDGG